MKFRRYILYCASLALTALLLFHIAGIISVPFVHRLENLSYDMRVQHMLPPPTEKQVVIIDIDEYSLDTIGQWPWPRDIIASITDRLFDYYRVSAVGFDVVFAEPDEDQAAKLLKHMAGGPLKNDTAFQLEYMKAIPMLEPDAVFASSLEYRKSILGFVMDTGTRKGKLPRPVVNVDASLKKRIPFIEAQGYSANLESLQASAIAGGFFDNPLLDDDGVYRRMPLLQLYNNGLYESLPLAVVRAVLNFPALELVTNTAANSAEDTLLEWIRLGNISIPVDQHAAILIPYLGPQNSFRYISAKDILDNKAAVTDLSGKIALLGASAAGLLDLRTTPLDAAFPGVEIHAGIIQGMLDGSVLHQPGYGKALAFIMLLLLGIVLTFSLPSLSPSWALMVCTALLVLLLAGNLAAWKQLQLVLPLAEPLVLVLLLFVLHMSYGYFVENRRKRRLTRLFGKYVPPALVHEISTATDEISLDGEIREMSVLFSDVRDFTHISEHMNPRELTQLINNFLTPITQVIHQQRGTIDKYMGDAVMAFWGAPLADPGHALHALSAAMDMVQQIEQLNPEFAARGWPQINIGIGINSGMMNVGNKGSEFRVDYTVLGDAVNLCSRLEGLTRVYAVDIIAGENTRNAVPEFEFRELDRVRVKGKHEPVAIYEPLGPVEAIDKTAHQQLQQYKRALEQYRARCWGDAEHAFASLAHDEPQSRIYQIYLQRIAHFRQQPPPDDWDGCYTHTSK